MRLSKEERLAEFRLRLGKLRPARTFHEAYRQIASTLNKVEDEYSMVPYRPRRWKSDGRLYPPRKDNAHSVPGQPNLTRFRSVRHNTYIGTNGSIEIRNLSEAIEFSKAGHDGRTVWEL